MFEMAIASEYHTYIEFVTAINRILVANRTSGLHDGGDTGFVGQFHAVVEGEESIGSEHGPMKVETKTMGFLDGLTQCINP